jgi:hypothetical protein
MATYYKAVDEDGRDFYSHTINYAYYAESGEWLPAKEAVPDPECRSEDVYHVSISKADTLIGGSWPCRLFEVEAEEVCSRVNKRGVFTMRIVRELPAWEALGPNGDAVVALIERCKALTADEAVRLQVARNAAWGTAWNATWSALWEAARGAAWNAARGAAWNAAWDATWHAFWYAAKNSAWRAARDDAWGNARNAAWHTARDDARDAARDAALALITRDLIGEENFNALHGPWGSAMEDGREI